MVAGTLVSVAIVMVVALQVLGQDLNQQAARLTFEVASIKPKPGPVTGGSVRLLANGRYERISATTSNLLDLAYPTTRGDILGAPDWIFTDRYDVLASAGREATLAEIRLMMRSLLEDRFKVRAHVESQEQPVWHMIVARADGRLGPELKPFSHVCGAAGSPACGVSASREAVRGVGVPVSRIASFLRSSGGRPIFDRTGLAGNFEFKLVYRPETGRPPDPSDERPDVFTALREQLGLRLESARGQVEVLIVEHIERPTPD